MSHIIPPLISDSPPPLDFTMESDEEDEFQPPIVDDPYSYDDSDIPIDLPDVDALEMDINRNKKEDKDFHDKRKTDANSEFNNSDLILPNIEEIVPNINKSNDDLSNDVKNTDSFDSEDLEIASIANNDDNLIPKIAETVITPTDEIADHKQNSMELDTNDYKRDRDINSPIETILNTEPNDKAYSDKELSSSEPNFETCSDNSQKEQENNETSTNNETHNKSICDADEINDDFGDFADFNNISSFNFTPCSEDAKGEQIDLHERSNIDQKTMIHSEDIFTHSSPDKDELTESRGVESADINSPEFTLDAIIISEKSTFNFTVDDEKEIDFVPEHITNDRLVQHDHNSEIKLGEIETINSKSFISNSAKTIPSNSIEPQPLQRTFDESDDEFGEFDSCSAAPTINEETEQPLPDIHIDRNNVDGRSKEILEMMFPVDNGPDIDFVQDGTEDDHLLSKIRNLTETNALTYQWNKSNTQQTLLKVLNVDVRNILYGPGCWNPSMPIFAANLSSAPLEPQKTNVPTITTSTSNNFNVESSCAAEAQFDWANSELTNPLDATVQKDPSLKDSSLGEPPKSFDSESVNSLQFTEALSENIDDKSVTLTELDNFTDFQNAKTAQQTEPSISTSAMFPLRETYINSNDRIEFNMEALTDNSEIVQNSTNDDVLQREFENAVTNSTPDEDFTEFQASLPEITLMESKQSTNRSIEYKLAIENPIEPELLANPKQSFKVLPKVLQPTILQPLKVANAISGNSALNIAWPEPGITDDEIKKFEEYSYSKTEQIITSGRVAKEKQPSKTARVVPKQPSIEDEWSDFQDAAKELPLSIASLGKIAQHQALSQQRNTITPNIVQTSLPIQNMWPNSYNRNTGTIHKDFYLPPTNAGVKQTLPTNNTSREEGRVKPQSRYDQISMLQPVPQGANAPHIRQANKTNDDEWSDFVCHKPVSIPSTSNLNLRQEDWTMNGPQFNSWTSTSVTPSTSISSALQFNGFNSFGRSANILNPSVKHVGSVQGKNKGNAQILGVSSKRESVPSISALPDLDFATSASRYSAGRLQHQKK